MIATWSGKRVRCGFDERRCYIEEHLARLDSIQHNLDQITVGWPENPKESGRYTSFMNSLSQLKSGVPIHVVRTPNKGYSYGQYSRIFDQYGSQFDYYILMEDDYIPTLNGFDAELIRMLENKRCDYLCSVCGPMYFSKKIMRGKKRQTIVVQTKGAAVSNGICHYRSLEKVKKRFGELLHHQDNGQRMFSEGFLMTDCTIEDYLDEYSALYLQHFPTVFRVYGDPSLPSIISPIQSLWDEGKVPRQVIVSK